MDTTASLKERRPNIISVLCGYFFVLWALGLIKFVLGMIQSRSLGFSLLDPQVAIFLVILLAFVASAVGLWLMKRWGAVVFALATVGLAVLYLIQQPFEWGILGLIIFDLVVQIVLAISGLLYYRRMS